MTNSETKQSSSYLLNDRASAYVQLYRYICIRASHGCQDIGRPHHMHVVSTHIVPSAVCVCVCGGGGVRVRACVHECVRACVRACVHACVREWVCVWRVHACMSECLRLCMCECDYTHLQPSHCDVGLYYRSLCIHLWSFIFENWQINTWQNTPCRYY